jgi:uncharacterized protein YbbC (DUF1343 family)
MISNDRYNLQQKENSMSFRSFFLLFFFLHATLGATQTVSVGADLLFTKDYEQLLLGKRVGLITNHTAINSKNQTTVDLLKQQAITSGFRLTALFAPEHGINGAVHMEGQIADEMDPDGIPIYSLYGATRRPTKEMLKKIDLLVYDIQDVGARTYTYITTLFYAMEEAAKHGIPVVVLDRPNPINGITVDGPMMEEKWRSFIGYINIPYCHGMTIGELAKFFNAEYKVGCKLHVVPMKGWKRHMTFKETSLTWVPTSPHIPEPTTPLYYPMTGILGELQMVNIGIGYTLPFKLIGAPWMNAKVLAKALNEQKFPGVYFQPFYYQPFYGPLKQQSCEGVYIHVTNPLTYKPVATQYLIIGMLKSLYPKEFKIAVDGCQARKEMFCKANGTEEVYRILRDEKYIVWKLRELHAEQRNAFMAVRQRYLITSYSAP